MSHGEDMSKKWQLRLRWRLYVIIATVVALVCWLVYARTIADWSDTATQTVAVIGAVYLMLAVLAILILLDALIRKARNLRFSVRTLAIFVTLVCVYFGAWDVTKRYGVPSGPPENPFLRNLADSPAPFIVRERAYRQDNPFSSPIRVYYLWLFGPKIKLPFESKWRSG